jgi:hypothetical protein
MKKIKVFIILSAILLFLTSFSMESGWIKLLDKNLNQWETYLSYRYHDDYNGSVPVNDKGETIKPVGYNKNEADVFSVAVVNNEPVLRISGEIYGCIFTKQEFQNYHFKLKVKWGNKKWEPRLKDPMDSGILYHSQGECGVDYWHSWMQSHEFQVMEGGLGDYWCCAATGANVRMKDPDARNDMGVYDPDGINTPMGVGGKRTGFVQHSHNFEKPGEWNTLELICFGDKSIHIVNGHVVMALSKLVSRDGDKLIPLTKGRIQLQSEAAEVFYKDIEIRKIDNVPDKYKLYFN